ncbi:MAG: efflux RND transporter periplasmic adaptor subunit [Chlamydiota bacterium]|nr:efflux RND transporter periplasmic adaptor subunit [Chlamydiota bacterium]
MRLAKGAIYSVIFLGVTIVLSIRLLGSFRQQNENAFIRVKLERHDLRKTVRGIGVLEAINMQDIEAPLEGKIIYIVDTPDDLIEKDVLLYEIENDEIETQLELATAEYEKASYEHQKAMSGPDPTVIFEREASFNKAQRNYDKKIQELENNKALYEKGFISEDAFNKLQDELKVLTVDRQLAQRKLEEAKEGTIQEELRVAQAQLDHKKLVLDKLKQKAILRKKTSGVKGKVIRKTVKIGDEIKEKQSLMVILDPEGGYRIRSKVMESDAISLHKNDPVLVRLPSLKYLINGRIEDVSLAAETVGNTKKYPIVINLDALEDGYIPHLGGHVEYEVVLEEKMGALSLPLTVINKYQQGQGVWIMKDNQRRFLPLTLGINDGVYVEVVEGLIEDQEIIIAESL